MDNFRHDNPGQSVFQGSDLAAIRVNNDTEDENDDHLDKERLDQEVCPSYYYNPHCRPMSIIVVLCWYVHLLCAFTSLLVMTKTVGQSTFKISTECSRTEVSCSRIWIHFYVFCTNHVILLILNY